MPESKRAYYEVNTVGGEKILLKTYSKKKAFNYRIKYAKERKIPRYGVGIDRLVWDKDTKAWVVDQLK